MERVVPDTTTEDPKDLRTKLDKALKELADTKAELTPLKNFKVVAEAGYSHLNEHQQKALFSGFSDTDTIDAKAIKDAAKNLGFQPAPTPVPAGVPDPNNPQGQVQIPGQVPGQVHGQGVVDPNVQQNPQQIPGQVPGQMPGQMVSPTPDQQLGQQFVPNPQLPPIPGMVPNPSQQAYEAQLQAQMVADGIQGLSAAEYANIMATRQGRAGDGAFSQAINAAQTPEQALGIVATQGKGVGLILESDID